MDLVLREAVVGSVLPGAVVGSVLPGAAAGSALLAAGVALAEGEAVAADVEEEAGQEGQRSSSSLTCATPVCLWPRARRTLSAR